MRILDEKLKLFLEKVRSKEYINKVFSSDEKSQEILEIARIAENENFITYSSNSKRPMIQRLVDGGWSLALSTQLTRAGHQFLGGYDRNVQQSTSQNFNIHGNISNAVMGNYNTQNIYYLEDTLKI